MVSFINDVIIYGHHLLEKPVDESVNFEFQSFLLKSVIYDHDR